MFNKIGKWFEIRREWRKLLKSASFEPSPLIQEYLNKKLKFEKETGWSFPHPSVIFPIIHVKERIIKNKTEEKLESISRISKHAPHIGLAFFYELTIERGLESRFFNLQKIRKVLKEIILSVQESDGNDYFLYRWELNIDKINKKFQLLQ
jgi:hypothetical protein